MRKMRHKVYDSIVALLADDQWHDVRELDEVTSYGKLWIDTLRRESRFEIDDSNGRLRLRPCPA